MKRILAVIFPLIAATAAAQQTAPDSWRTRATAPNGFSCCGAGVAGGRAYFFGGWDYLNEVASPTLAYDPVTDTWTTRAASMYSEYMGYASLNGLIYCVGGSVFGGTPASVLAYDPAADVWSPRASMSTARTFLGCAVAGGRIYAMGGESTYADPVTGELVGGGFLDSVEAYDPETDTWSPRQPMPAARWLFYCGAVGEKVYVAGGRSPDFVAVRDTWEYDPATDTWTECEPMPAGAYDNMNAGAGVGVGDCFYCVGGEGDLYRFDNLFEFTPASNTWAARASVPPIAGVVWEDPGPDNIGGLCNGAAVTLGGRIYAIGYLSWSYAPDLSRGYDDQNFPYYCDKLLEYTPPGGAPPITGAANPTALAQKAGDGADIAPGAEVLAGSLIRFDAEATVIGDASRRVQLEIEVDNVHDGSKILSVVGPLSDQGPVSVTLTLHVAPGAFRWKARTVPESGDPSAWVDFGLPAHDPDFWMQAPVPPPPPPPPSTGKKKAGAGAICGATATGSSGFLTAMLCALIVVARRRSS